MKDELDDPTSRQESGSLEAGLFAGDAAEDNSFEARRPSSRDDEEGSIENRTEISEAVVDEKDEDEDDEADGEEDDEDDDDEDENEVDELASDEEDEDDEDDDDDDDEEEAE